MSDWKLGAYAGEWIHGGGAPVEVRAPATDELLGTFAAATPAVVAQACEAAAAAQPAWSAAGAGERARVLSGAADRIEAERDEVVAQLVRESGSTLGKAAGEVAAAVAELRSCAAQAVQPQKHALSADRSGQLSFAERVSIGVVAAITPWNVPLLLATRTVAPALALGNTVVLKPDPHTPVSGGALLVEALAAAGLPAGALAVVLGGVETGEALVADPRVQMVSFTGSTAAGRRVGALAGGLLKKVALELGGNNPLIVLADADVDRASSAGAWGAFQHQGQVCMAASRHLVHESIADEYLARLCERAERLTVGDPERDPDVAMGPLIDDRQLDRVDGIVRASVAAGATLVTGGTHEQRFYRPTVLAGVTTSMPAFSQEIFGPVAPVTTFADDDEAVALAGTTDYGLSAAVHSASPERALRVGARLSVGMVHVNDQTVNDVPHAPFGGRGASGNGSRFGGDANWEAFTQWQWTTVSEKPPEFPF